MDTLALLGIPRVEANMAASENFVAKYEARDLPYTAEIIAALRDGSARVSRVPEDGPPGRACELLRTYERRAKHLSRFSTRYAAQLRGDVEKLCTNLGEKKSDRCVAWGFECDPYYVYWFWEWASDGSYLGATKTVDDRKISDSERVALWGLAR